MTKLNPKILETYPYHYHADRLTIQRGRAYYDDGRVWNIEISDDQAVCDVDGDSSEYTVVIDINEKNGQLRFECDCPFAEGGNFCKHMVAAGLELKDYLEEQLEDTEEDITTPQSAPPTRQWKNKLDTILTQLPRPTSSGSNPQRYAAFVIMEKGHSFYYGPNYSFTPYVVKTKNWNILQELAGSDPHTINDLLEKNQSWIHSIDQLYGQTNPAGCINLSPEASNLLKIIQQYTRLFGGANLVPNYLVLLAQLDIPVFQANLSRKTIQGRVTILPEPVKLQITFRKEKGNLLLEAALQHEKIKRDI